MLDRPYRFEISKHGDHRGLLNSIELPFEISRVYYIQNSGDLSRGHHAHKTLKQIFFCLAGSCVLTISTPNETLEFRIQAHDDPIVVPHGHWRVLSNFSFDCTLVVMASDHYDELDYIRDYDEYLCWFESREQDES
jgi:hypothetical protein